MFPHVSELKFCVLHEGHKATKKFMHYKTCCMHMTKTCFVAAQVKSYVLLYELYKQHIHYFKRSISYSTFAQEKPFDLQHDW